MLKNVAIILAGGSGSRMRLETPKQFLKIAGKPVIEHTLDIFDEHRSIDEIIIIITPGYKKDVEKITKKHKKVTKIIEKAVSRNEGTKAAIASIDAECNVIIHDAVRPFVSSSIIQNCINALEKYNSVDVAIPSADTIIEVRGDIIQSIPDRASLRRGQTPQAFKLSTIKKAYEIAGKDKNFQATDDCGVVLKYLPDEKTYVVEGEESNIKITHPLDATIADKLFQLNASEVAPVGEEYRRKALKGATIVIFGGSYGIGKEITTLGKEYGAKVHTFSRSKTGTDVKNEEDVKKALKDVYDEDGKINFVVNTAGELVISPLEDMESLDIENAIKANYTAPVMVAKYAKPYLEKSKGQLLLFTSSSYTRGRSNYSLYSSSKAATVNLTQALAEEWHEDGVRINCINPERTATPMRVKAFGEEDPSKLLKAEDVANASIDALLSNLTGQVFDVRIK